MDKQTATPTIVDLGPVLSLTRGTQPPEKDTRAGHRAS